MASRLCSLLLLSVLLSSCVSSTDAKEPRGLLCMEVDAGAQKEIDCLDVRNAASTANRRVALYNEGKPRLKTIACQHRKALGTTFSRWRCYRNRRNGEVWPAEDTVTDRALGRSFIPSLLPGSD